MNNGPIRGRSSETKSYPIDMNTNNTLPSYISRKMTIISAWTVLMAQTILRFVIVYTLKVK
jgi:hypothetical protein